jgi:hypothetical protein
MDNYKLLFKDNSCKKLYIDKISFEINSGVDIFSIQPDDSEIYLGSISHRVFLYIAINTAKYVINNTNYISKERNEKMHYYLELCTKWFDNQNSVELSLLKTIHAQILTKDYMHREACMRTLISCILSFEEERQKHNFDLLVQRVLIQAAMAMGDDMGEDPDFFENAIGGWESDSYTRAKYSEYIRQGRFIIDLIKSGEHLFIM